MTEIPTVESCGGRLRYLTVTPVKTLYLPIIETDMCPLCLNKFPGQRSCVTSRSSINQYWKIMVFSNYSWGYDLHHLKWPWQHPWSQFYQFFLLPKWGNMRIAFHLRMFTFWHKASFHLGRYFLCRTPLSEVNNFEDSGVYIPRP